MSSTNSVPFGATWTYGLSTEGRWRWWMGEMEFLLLSYFGFRFV